MAFGKQLKEILDSKGMTVTGFSRLSGIPKATLYSYIKRDTERPNVDVYIALAQIGVDVDAMLGRTPKEVIEPVNSPIETFVQSNDPNVQVLLELTPDELQRVADFARGLIAARRL